MNAILPTQLGILVGLAVFMQSTSPAASLLAQDEFLQALRRDQVVAWCIVPFDKSQRSPQERVEMLQRLGLKRVAYDWRTEHVASFETEFVAYEQAGIEFFAFWDVHDSLWALLEKHDWHPQIWKIMPTPDLDDPQAKIEGAAKQLLPLVEKTRQYGCRLGLYNHGGWSGQPENLVSVVRWLREHHDAQHVGIVYNFHHGHEHIERFEAACQLMLPYLWCVNLNGMNPNEQPKILPLGDGEQELAMLKTLQRLKYQGPFGILDHRPELDAELSLRENLEGLDRLRATLADESDR